MIMQYIQLVIYTTILVIITNYLRFKGRTTFNKGVLVVSSLVVVEMEGLLFDFTNTTWILAVFIGISVICFQIVGGLVSTFVSCLILYTQIGESDLTVLFSYLLFAALVYLLARWVISTQQESDNWLSKLTENAKQLNVFKEVSFSMQQTLNLQKLLKTILTSVTAGYGLGFNRAIILLIDENGSKLSGIMGTGPMTAEEGYITWNRITKSKYTLMDLIENKEGQESIDLLLNDRVKRLEIPLDEPNFLYRTLESETPLHIKGIDENDKALMVFAQQFNMSELAVFPLISQGTKVGILIVDNPVNRKPITATAIDSVIPLANQAAIAIQHTRLYSKIEDMALKDGLTALFNQRAFQTVLEQHWTHRKQSPLSTILIDIDYFKHFNDTNGHLLGNQVLIQLADVIKSSIDNQDLAFRFGGEEFVVLLPSTSKEAAVQVAERIRMNVENTSFPCGEKQPAGRLTISLGVASTEEMQSSIAFDLVDIADRALYRAKEAGKNKVVC
ncbi:putative diguanylate cyclase YcdT [compost metagenome]